MTLYYSKVTGEHYLDRSDEYEEEGYDFEYEISYGEFVEALANVYFDKKFPRYNDSEKREIAVGILENLFIDMFTDNSELQDEYEDMWREEITDYYEHDAMGEI